MSLRNVSLVQFKAHLEQRHLPDLAGEAQHFSAGEVEEMSPEQYGMTLHHTALIQRGAPEAAMLHLQKVAGGGVLSGTAEHLGDLTHRINESGGRFGLEFVAPKVKRTLGTLAHPYGFTREHEENMRANRTDPEALAAAGTAYSKAHMTVPVYNKPSNTARWAAWNLGRGDYGGARTHMHNLAKMIEDPRHYQRLVSQEGAVEFLRQQEERGY